MNETAKLVCTEGPYTGWVIPIQTATTTVGRDRSNVIALVNDNETARVHAHIITRQGNYSICDMDSLSGTFVNNIRINGVHPLTHGCTIKIGNNVFKFEIGELAQAQQPRSSAGTPLYREDLSRMGYSVVPPELEGKFNWGAFLLSFIWGFNHKAGQTLFVFSLYGVLVVLGIWQNSMGEDDLAIGCFSSLLFTASPIIIIGLHIWYGAKGYEWAWNSGRFKDAEHCLQVQKIWAVAGLITFVVFVLIIGLLMSSFILSGASG